MDLNPIVTPNDVLTNCLNGTLVTFNGNENVLQNDMGNGRVETAYLPEGYVPVGTAELGGIIYIVSYNPLTDKCQIGSFPSPERNITSDEITVPEKEISNNSFQNDWDSHHKKITSSIVKLTLLDDSYKLCPGDKYTIYTNNLWGNINSISDCQKENNGNYFGCHPRNVTIHVVSLGDDGKITYLDSNQKWDYNEKREDITANYYIKNTENTEVEEIKKDLDNYRSLVTTAYNVFNSKVSGELALLFEVETINSFELTWDAIVQDLDEKNYDKQVTIKFNSNWSSSNYSINPKYLVLSTSDCLSSKLEIPNNCKKGCYAEYGELSGRKNDGESDSDVQVDVGDFKYNSASLTDYIWNYGAVPAMAYGILPQYEVKGSINFSEIGSGKIEIIQWKYYIEDNDFYIKLGVDAYPEKNKKIYYIDIKFIPISKVTENLFKDIVDKGEKGKEEKDIYTDYFYRIENKNSYSGYFQELLYLGNTSNSLKKNELYVVDIVFKYGSDNEIKYKHHFKFLYTIKIFNDLYLTEKDFENINLYNVIADYIKIQSTYTEKIDSTLKIGQFYPNIPDTSTPVHYGCQYAIVNPDEQQNLTVTNEVKFYKYSELFSFKQQNNDTITVKLSKPENSISNTATVNSDSVNNSADNILPIINEKWEEQTPDEWKDGSGEKFKTAFDTFTFSQDEKTGNVCTFAIKGYYFNKINALYSEKDIKAQNIIKSVLSNKSDLSNFGYNEDLTITKWHSIASGENGGGGGWTLTYYPNQDDWGSAIHAEDCYDDCNQISNWWDYLSNDPGNVWNNLQNSKNSHNFPIIKWHKRDSGWIRDDSADKEITGQWSIWVLTDGGHVVPLRSLYRNPESAASAVLNFLVQLYYVDTTGYDYKDIRVNIINYLSNFVETWKLDITSTVSIKNPNYSIYIGSASLAYIQDKIDKNYLSINNINAENMKSPAATITNFQHSFKCSSIDLQELFQNDKKTTVGSLLFNNWTGNTEEIGIKNANNLYILSPSNNTLYEANPINVQKYMRKNCKINIDDNSVKLSGGTIANISTQIMNYMSYYDGKMHFKESGLSGEPIIRFSDTDGEGDSSYWKITNNTPYKFPIE